MNEIFHTLQLYVQSSIRVITRHYHQGYSPEYYSSPFLCFLMRYPLFPLLIMHPFSLTDTRMLLSILLLIIAHQSYKSKLFVPHSFIANQIRTVYLIVQALFISKITVPPSLGQQQQHQQQQRLHGRYIRIARQQRQRPRYIITVGAVLYRFCKILYYLLCIPFI